MSIWPFRRNQAHADAELLLAAIVAASRRPGFYGAGKVPDTLEGRFELLTLHASLALTRLQAAPEAESLAQAFTDKLFRHIDSGLREAGVGDLIVPKRMRRLAGDFYGRLGAYAGALGNPAALAEALRRNLLGPAGEPGFDAKVAAYAARLAALQGGAPVSGLLEPKGWADDEFA